jgi:protein-S-isoprenylcysteine O-methyltransferase Ste14
MTARSNWNIAAGHWCFRHRNAVFPLVFALTVLFLRPHVLFGRTALDHLLIASGMVIALVGQGVRLLTIGFDYVERGGKNKRVYASRLVQGGIYAHTRNPMYLGNLLIAAGMSLVTGAPAAYLLLIPLFVFIYQAIIAAEEAYLRERFGAEYAAYCRRVPRLFPSLKGVRRTFGSMEYHWRRAVRKDLSTITGLLLGLICLPLWRTYFLNGADAARAALPATAALVGAVLVLYGALAVLKKRRLFFYLPTNLPSDVPGGLR